MTTTYNIFKATTEGETLVATKGKKQVAIDLATTIRITEKVGVRVETSKGTEVLVLKARKPQKKTPAYTRVVALPDGFEAPEGQRVAYLRGRKNAAIMHDAEEMTYTVRRFTTGEVLGVFSTTRQCGRFLADHVTAEGVVVASLDDALIDA